MPEEYGGGGGTFAHQAVVTEELAKAGVHFGCGVQSIVSHYILHYGNEEQKKKWLPAMAQGELVGAIAMTEPSAGSDLQAIKTTARREGNDYILNGSKTFITNGWHANLVCVAAKTDPRRRFRGISMIVVETRDLKGIASAIRLKKWACTRSTPVTFLRRCARPGSKPPGKERGGGVCPDDGSIAL